MQIQLLTTLLYLLCGSHASGRMQYCRVIEEQGVDFCVSFASFHNSTSNENDLYILSSTKFTNGEGWSAVGTGESMAGSLMFVFYPGPGNTDATVSLRTTRGHYPPKPAENAPHHQVLGVFVERHYYNISLVCYGCDKWSGNSLGTQSRSQPLIYAMQPYQKMQPTDEGYEMKMHADYSVFYVDMAIIHSDSGQPSVPRLVENGRQSVGLKEDVTIGWSTIHGSVMILAFTVLAPTAVACLRSGARHAFTAHWILQSTALAIACGSASFALAKTWNTLEFSLGSTMTQHVYFGSLIVVLLVPQSCLGMLHHLRYLKNKSKTWISLLHIWLGRTLIVCAWINTAIGVGLVQANFVLVVIWLVSLGIMVSAMIWAGDIRLLLEQFWRGLRHETSYQPLKVEIEI